MNPISKRYMILGPTASGKTDLAVRLARRIHGEIISVDSRQCYRGIEIGTAKPSSEQLRSVPHHNISILDPEVEDTVSDFLERVRLREKEIRNRGRRIIYAGGSTLHLQALIRPLDPVPPKREENLEELRRREGTEGLEALMNQLRQVDPDYAERVDGLNRHRIFRALDVWMQTGRPFSSFHSLSDRSELTPPEDLLVFGLHWPRKELHRRIGERVDSMLESGLVKETKQLLDAGYSPELQFLRTVGYRSVIRHLEGEMDSKDLPEAIKTQTRRYAKRQLTWFRKWRFIHWLDAAKPSEHLLGEILETARRGGNPDVGTTHSGSG